MTEPAVQPQLFVVLAQLLGAVRVAEEIVRGDVVRQHHPPLVAGQHGVPGRRELGVGVELRPRVLVAQDDPLVVSEEAGPEQCAPLSLVESFIVLLRQHSYAIKNQLVASKAPY